MFASKKTTTSRNSHTIPQVISRPLPPNPRKARKPSQKGIPKCQKFKFCLGKLSAVHGGMSYSKFNRMQIQLCFESLDALCHLFTQISQNGGSESYTVTDLLELLGKFVSKTQQLVPKKTHWKHVTWMEKAIHLPGFVAITRDHGGRKGTRMSGNSCCPGTWQHSFPPILLPLRLHVAELRPKNLAGGTTCSVHGRLYEVVDELQGFVLDFVCIVS